MLVIFQLTWRRKWVLEIFGEAGVKGQLNRVLSNFTFTRGCGLIYARCLFKRLTECSGGRASIIKNAFLFFNLSIHLYPTIISFLSFYLSIFCVRKKSQYMTFPHQARPVCYFEDQTYSQMTFWPQPVNSSHSYNWNHLHQGKMKRALLRASFPFTTCVISAGCISQRLFLE